MNNQTEEILELEMKLLEFFDEDFYLEQISDDQVADALEHYLEIGWKAGFDPAPNFSTRSYLQRNPDVAKARINPFWHFIFHGRAEGRSTEMSKRRTQDALILTASKEIDGAVAALLARTFRPGPSKTPLAEGETQVSNYLANGWREPKPPAPGWRRREPAFERPISRHERAKILAAADAYISNSNLFAALKALAHPAYYAGRCEDAGVVGPGEFDMDVVTHYLAIGRHFRISITPVFDVAYYVEAAQFLGLSPVDPANALIHYLSEGEAQGLRPCSFFNPEYYRTRYGTSNDRPLLHYITEGARIGHLPSPGFWSNWYCETHKIGTVDPLVHFYMHGIDQGLRPNPLIDLQYYARQRNLSDQTIALRDYVTVGYTADFNPTPLIDIGHIVRQATDMGIKRQETETVVELYLRAARDLDPHPLFHTDYYLDCYEGEAPIAQPLAHYIETSLTEPKSPNPYFNDRTYYDARPDIAVDGVCALTHYVMSGWRENVKVHPLVDHDHLRTSLPASGDTTPLEAVITGRADDKVTLRSPLARPNTMNQSKWLPVALDIERAAEHYPVLSPDSVSVGILAHIFYVELLPEVIAFASNVPQRAVLLVSTNTSAKRQAIVAELEKSGLPDWEVRVCENRGRDIAPSFLGFADRLKSLDYGVHIHSKRSYHYGSSFEKWRHFLFAENGGSRQRVEAILRVLHSNPTLGALAPVDFGPIRNLVSWGHNRPMVEALLVLAGRQDPLGEASLEFPSGSMFWFRVDALRGFYRTRLDRYHFDPENGQADGTLAHAIERAFFLLIETEGYDWARFCSGDRLGGYSVTDDITFARSRVLPSHKVTDPVSVKMPETARFYCRAVDNSRPRLNLLIPTCDTGVGYAGVSEAIRQFRAIGDRLGPQTDLRIIATDEAFGAMTVPPQGFVVCDSLVEDSNMRAVPGYLRRSEPLGLRRNDYFVTSAWWNAIQAFDLLDKQAAIYGTDVRHRVIYLIQDFEPGFYPWSTRWALAESTYRHPDQTIAIYNTPILSDFMSSRYKFGSTHVYKPLINEGLHIPSEDRLPQDKREKIVLLYARPHAERNCLEMIDAIVAFCVEQDPAFWSGWRFLAIGETFRPNLLRCSSIEILGRLTLEDYRDFLGKARLGISIMVSPHPSYPPLEMAANGVRVLTNTYENKDLSKLHENIESFQLFDPPALARRLRTMAEEKKVPGKPLIDWFFDGQNNIEAMAEAVAHEVRSDLGLPEE